MFVATELIGPLLMHLVPAIRQIDKQLSFDDNDKDMPQDPELLAIWLLNPLRLTKLYQLRCLANLDSCDENIQVSQVNVRIFLPHLVKNSKESKR